MKKWYYVAPLAAAAVLAACTSDTTLPSSPSGIRAPGGLHYSISGAFNTNLYTAGSCSGVNGNLYPDKASVALNGNPSTVEAGNYYVKVEAPDGTPLGHSTTATFVVDGINANCAQLITLVNKESDGTAGFDTTPNHGGEYKVTISHDITFPSGDIKSDNFKIREDVITTEGDPDVSGMKYYDANANGQWDSGEIGIVGWPITVNDGFLSTTINTTSGGTFSFTGITGTVYTVAEQVANGPWYQTGNTVNQATNATLLNFVYSFTAASNTNVSGLNFGNVCTGAGSGLTLGYWSNKNGQALIGPPDLTMLRALNLVYNSPAIGTAFDPTTAAQVKSFLLNGTATNMAYMLSVQLTAMELNVAHGVTTGSAIVYVPTLGFKSITDLMTLANTSLGLHPNTVAAGPDRTYQEILKTALDLANNGQGFVQPSPATCPTPVFPSTF